MTTEIIRKYIDILAESGLSRVYDHTRKHDYGTITAFRYAPDCGTGEPYTLAQNQARNKSLLSKLRAQGYSVTSIAGSYIENYGTPQAREVAENSYLVVDIQDRGTLEADLLALGEEFEQDSIIFGSADGDGALIGTNNCPDGYPGYHNKAVQGGAIFGKSGQFMSRVNGRPFVFAEGTEVVYHGVAKYPTELRGLVETAKRHWSELL